MFNIYNIIFLNYRISKLWTWYKLEIKILTLLTQITIITIVANQTNQEMGLYLEILTSDFIALVKSLFALK